MRSTIAVFTAVVVTSVVVGCGEPASPSPFSRDQRFEVAGVGLAVTFPFDWRVDAPMSEVDFSAETEYEMSLWWDLTAKGPNSSPASSSTRSLETMRERRRLATSSRPLLRRSRRCRSSNSRWQQEEEECCCPRVPWRHYCR